MGKKKIPENHYRASRICRVLGNPTAYEILCILKKGKRKPTDLARQLGIHISTISHALKTLRNLDLIRYEVRLNERIYWIKEETIISVLEILDSSIKKIKARDY